MKLNHLDDEAIQQFALDEAVCEASVINHINACEYCESRAATYRMMFAGIMQQPKPVFEFDAAELVLAKLPQAKPVFEWNRLEPYMVVGIIATVVIVTLYIFRNYVLTMLSGMAAYIMYTIAATVITVIIYHVYEMYKKYQRQLNSLNYY